MLNPVTRYTEHMEATQKPQTPVPPMSPEVYASTCEGVLLMTYTMLKMGMPADKVRDGLRDTLTSMGILTADTDATMDGLL